MMKMKTCTKCGKNKLLVEFYERQDAKDGHRSQCKTCMSTRAHGYYMKNRGLWRKWDLQRKFGITLTEYDKILKKQGGGCAVCGKPQEENDRHLCVDHCHKTGKVRGLLCNDCNVGLGRFHDDPALLFSAINYIEAGGL